MAGGDDVGGAGLQMCGGAGCCGVVICIALLGLGVQHSCWAGRSGLGEIGWRAGRALYMLVTCIFIHGSRGPSAGSFPSPPPTVPCWPVA